jgi:hypothetical protein
MPHVHFASFGSLPEYGNTLRRIEKEARESKYFDTVTIYTQDNVPRIGEFREFIAKNRRGYGYWIWKPLVILDRMAHAAPDDIIVYADAGCSTCTNDTARKSWAEWLSLVETHPTHRISFEQEHMEETWTKMDLAARLGCADDPAIMKTGQRLGGLQMMRNTSENQALVQEWLSTMSCENGKYITDAPSTVKNASSFREHRHDQSVISLLMKLRGSAVTPAPWRDPIHPILCLRKRA